MSSKPESPNESESTVAEKRPQDGIGVSAGIAEWTCESPRSFDELLGLADHRMYEDKQARKRECNAVTERLSVMEPIGRDPHHPAA